MRDRIVILSGGTATNDLVPLFNSISTNITFVLPILDNGGSTSEIIRVIGGPAIGDIRSRLTRLIPDNKVRLRDLLTFRLDQDPSRAKAQWNEIVDGSHPLWNGIALSTKEIFRAFLVHVHVELLKRSKISMSSTINKQFRYELANVGNLFLTGMRLFIGSLDSAIELFMKLTDISSKIEVLPCINTNFSYHIGAKLSNDLLITGQSQISHPSSMKEIYPLPIDKTRPPTPTRELDLRSSKAYEHLESEESGLSSEEEDGNLPLYTHPELKKSQLHFSKTEDIEPLLSPIKRIFYISPYGEEICPTAQSRVISSIANANLVIYSVGSLMTSIVPIIILKGVGRAIASDLTPRRTRILFLNGCADRETFGMQAFDYVRIIVELAQYSVEKSSQEFDGDWTKFVTHLFYMELPNIFVDIQALHRKGIKCISIRRDDNLIDRYDLSDLQEKLQETLQIN